MSEEKQHTINGLPLPTRGTRRKIVYGTLVYCAAVIVGILVWGNPDNTLHTSGLSWAFFTAIGMISAYVFGAVLDNWTVWKNKE